MTDLGLRARPGVGHSAAVPMTGLAGLEALAYGRIADTGNADEQFQGRLADDRLRRGNVAAVLGGGRGVEAPRQGASSLGHHKRAGNLIRVEKSGIESKGS